MSTPQKPDDARGWLFVEKLISDEDAEKEMERLEKMSEEELGAEMRAKGGEAPRLPTTEELLAGAEARARAKESTAKTEASAAPATTAGGTGAPAATPGHPAARPAAEIVPLRRRPVWVVSLLAAALGVIVYVIGTGGGSGSGNRVDAKQLRKEALAACDAKNWDACESKLDQAKSIDPEGENDARIVAARTAIAQARRGGGDR